MAGRQPKAKTPEEIKQLERDLKLAQSENDALRNELTSLKAIVARQDPQSIVATLEKAPFLPDKATCERVLALGLTGMSPTQIQAEFSWSDEEWKEAKNMYREFKAALTRSRAHAIAMWHQRANIAMLNNDWKFPHDRVQAFIKNMFEEDEEDIGDASTLIHVAIGKEQRALFSR